MKQLIVSDCLRSDVIRVRSFGDLIGHSVIHFVLPDESLLQALTIMGRENLSTLPVLDESQDLRNQLFCESAMALPALSKNQINQGKHSSILSIRASPPN